jgi:UDP-2-acetamido-2-deoxy-ribo-hexuluronate aminotransferase
MDFIDLNRHYLFYQKTINARIEKVLKHSNYIMGPEIQELETKLSEFVGVKHCITVASGTDSLEIALRALGIGHGDEVITVPFSWISSVEIIVQVGATPVFVDIESDSFNINPELIEKVITKQTKAIIAVSLFGQMPKIELINKIASKYNIAVIEDAAQSFGATRDGVNSCGASVIGSTSFFPAKPLGCFGDGGALFTNDDKLALIMKAIRSHGGLERHNHTHIGMNGRFDTIQAAIILGKIDGFKQEVELRSKIGERYSAKLKDHVITPIISDRNTHVYAQYTIRVGSELREMIINKLKQKGIPSGIYYPKCLHEQPVFQYLNYKKGDFPIAEKASSEVMSLPMHPFLTHKERDVVIEELIKILTLKE